MALSQFANSRGNQTKERARRLFNVQKMRLAIPLVLAIGISSFSADAQQGIPHLAHTGDQVDLMVDGSPFLILGGQARNSSASTIGDAERVYKALNFMHANTAEIPISWNLIEPQRGNFTFELVDDLVRHARSHDLHLIFLWFGTTKNATLSYAPDWIKQDRHTYFRAQDAAHREMYAISPFCTAAREADERAFAALMKHISEIDATNHTVLMVQVENETGLIQTDRDHSPAADKAFDGAVAPELVDYLLKRKEGLRPALLHAWQSNGCKMRGTWTEVFGDLAPEAFSAWTFAKFTDAVAASGKAKYALPLYVNVALMNTGASRPGEWPSGGAAANVIDIWKAAAPNIDLIAPDIYRNDFPEIADIYDRSDNPLLVPETGFAPYYAPYVFTTLAGHNGLGFAPFGVDDSSNELSDGYDNGSEQHKEAAPSIALTSMEEVYRVLRPLLPLIEKKRYQNSMFPIVLNFYRHEAVSIPVADDLAAVVHFDEVFVANTSVHRAGGIIIKLAPDQFVVAGEGFHLDFEELKGLPRNAEFLSIEEGTFENDHWVRQKVLNGDEENVRIQNGKPRILLVHLNRLNRM